MMKILVIEDEHINYLQVEHLLKTIDPQMEVVGPLTSVKDVLSYFNGNHLQPDLIVSDIKLSDGLVFEAFEHIKLELPVVFITAYNEHAIHAFEYYSIDYLLKPLSLSAMEHAIEKYRKMTTTFNHSLSNIARMVNPPFRKRLLCPTPKGIQLVSVEDISFIRMEAQLVNIYLRNGENHFSTTLSLTEIEKQLDPQCFFRANRNDIINLAEIDCLSTGFMRKAVITMRNFPDEEIHVSKERFSTLRKLLED